MGTSRISYFTTYAEDADAEATPEEGAEETAAEAVEIVIPEDLTELPDDELANLHGAAVDAFTALYGDGGQGLSDDDLTSLSVLTEGVERVQSEISKREEAAGERAEAATALAQRISPDLTAESAATEELAAEDSEAGEEGAEDGSETLSAETEDEEPEPEQVTASAPREIRVNLSGLRSRQAGTAPSAPEEPKDPRTMKDIVRAAPEFSGFTNGEGLDWSDIGKGLDRRLASFNRSQWEQANAQNRHLRTQMAMAVIQKPFSSDLMITSPDPIHIDKVLQHARNEERLPSNSLVASGGWCAPSETIYDLCEMESRDGLFTVPEVGITRGGINTTTGPDFAEIYANTGFCYTEAEDEAGDYDGAGGGAKPCYTVPCPDFTETRLDYCGLCINAGLLQQRGYPEMIARTTRGALVAHDHRMSANAINQVVAGSTAVTMPSPQVGATAPLLTAIELQVEHYKYANRLARSTSLEAVFPYWVRGVIRSDLSRRLGVDLIDVPDSRIDGWFSDRGLAPQFVYDWQDLTGTPETFTQWPTEVSFLLYAAGTWVRGTSDIITMDTVYDSVMLGTNDFTALFTEEGSLMAKMCNDSRVVTVSLCGDGATHGGVDIACDGTEVAAPAA